MNATPTIPNRLYRLADLERASRRISIFHGSLVPGLAQCEDYARAVLEGASGSTNEAVAARLAFRFGRQAVLEEAQVDLILGEPALTCTPVPSAMKAQLARLIELNQRRNVTVRVVPSSDQVYRQFGRVTQGPARFYDLFGSNVEIIDGNVVFVETAHDGLFGGDSDFSDLADPGSYVWSFNQAAGLALRPTETEEYLFSLMR